MPFAFRVEARFHSARAGVLTTDHGTIETPVFMPVGTQGTVKGVTARDVWDTGARLILGNTYHLYLRPGVNLIERAGGLHRFIGWDGALLTDSGGYQLFSLASLMRVTDAGVTFRSHIEGSLHEFTPESVMETQARIGADIIMSFDYFQGIPCERKEAERSVELTTAWARRGLQATGARFDRYGYEQVVFGIVQGAEYADLRARSTSELAALDFPGYAIGGLSVGEGKDATWDIAEGVTATLPTDRPRYLMGMGTPIDLIEAVARGVDMLDCVLPTRNARNGTVFTRDGKIALRNAVHADELVPLDSECRCVACRRHTRAYLRHLFMSNEMLGPMLATSHNLQFYNDVMRAARAAIVRGDFDVWRRAFVDRYTRGGEESEAQEASEPQRRMS
jgi:queuine tRNA-ribosyltransferase